MDLQSQENVRMESATPVIEHQPQTCPKCQQTFAFVEKCPTCATRDRETTERALVRETIKEQINCVVFNSWPMGIKCSLSELRKLSELLIVYLKRPN